MFSALRQQARLSLRTVSRAAAPASRTLSSFSLRQVTAAPTVSRLVGARAFSYAKVLSFEDRNLTPTTPSESLYVANMPWDMTKEDLTELFAEFGEIKNVRIQTNADGRPRGFAHLTFASQESAAAAIASSAAEPFHVAGRDLYVDYARQHRNTNAQEPNKKLYFARYTQDENSLRQALGEFKDQIVSVYFIRDGNTGEKTNAGFVEFASVDTATEVVNKVKNIPTPDGGFLSFSYARPRRDNGTGERRRGGRQGNQTPYTNRGYESRGNDY